MNSKEYLQQIATTEVIDCTNNDKAKKRIANIFPVGISVIEKDLEVLEILKRMLTVEKGSTWYYLDTKHPFFEKQEDIDKVKDWLENE